MDYSRLQPEARFQGPYGTYRFKDYAGAGATRCLMPLALKASRVRSFTRYQCFTGKQVHHSVTGELLDVSWSEHVARDDFVHSQVRCRICPNCIALNSWIWAKAACLFHDTVMDDGGSSAAVTLTFADNTFRRWWGEDRDRRALEFEKLGKLPEAQEIRNESPPGRFFPNNREHIRLAVRGLGRELTLYNKRLRIHAARKPGILPTIKAWMGALEFGTKRGRPHLHILYHLQGDETRCRWFRRHAKSDWATRVGFTKVNRVCTYSGCSYASKYIGKTYDAGFRIFFENLSGNSKGRFGTPVLTEAQSIEYARLLAVAKCQRTRTRSSLGYRSRGVTAPTQHTQVGSPPPHDHHTHNSSSTAKLWGDVVAQDDGCDSGRSDHQYTDHWEEHVARFWAGDFDPTEEEDSDNGSEHCAEGEMPDPPD